MVVYYKSKYTEWETEQFLFKVSVYLHGLKTIFLKANNM